MRRFAVWRGGKLCCSSWSRQWICVSLAPGSFGAGGCACVRVRPCVFFLFVCVFTRS